MTNCTTPHGELGARISALFGGQVRSVTVRFAVGEIVTATIEHIVKKETAEGIVTALETQTWVNAQPPHEEQQP